MDGEEIKKTYRKSKENEMPVGPCVLGLFLFLVVGSAFFQILQTSQQGGVVEWSSTQAKVFTCTVHNLKNAIWRE